MDKEIAPRMCQECGKNRVPIDHAICQVCFEKKKLGVGQGDDSGKPSEGTSEGSVRKQTLVGCVHHEPGRTCSLCTTQPVVKDDGTVRALRVRLSEAEQAGVDAYARIDELEAEVAKLQESAGAEWREKNLLEMNKRHTAERIRAFLRDQDITHPRAHQDALEIVFDWARANVGARVDLEETIAKRNRSAAQASDQRCDVGNVIITADLLQEMLARARKKDRSVDEAARE